MNHKHSFPSDEDANATIDRYEQFLSGTNSAGYFDVSEYESIIEYYLRRGRNADCARAIRLGLKTHPNNGVLRLKRAKMHLYSGDAVKALHILNSLTEKDDQELILLKIGALLKLKREPEANILCAQILNSQQTDKSENLFLDLSAVYINFGQFKLAIKLLQQGEKLNPENIDLLLELAYCYEQISLYEDAIAAHHKIIKIKPYTSESWFNLGQIHFLLHEHNKSLEAYDFALAIEPNDSLACLQKSHCLVYLKRYQEALSCYYEYAELNASYNWQLYNFIAECYEKLENFDQAIENYKKALELNEEENYDVLTGLSICLLEKERYRDCQPYIRRAIALQPDFPDAWIYLGESYVGLEDTESALDAYLTALEKDSNLPETLLAVGNIFLEKNDFQMALYHYKLAYSEDQELEHINLFLAISHFKLGKTIEALHFLKEAVDSNDNALNLFLEVCPEATTLLTKIEGEEPI